MHVSLHKARADNAASGVDDAGAGGDLEIGTQARDSPAFYEHVAGKDQVVGVDGDDGAPHQQRG